MNKEVKLWDKDICFTCVHRHHQKPTTCKVEPCRYRRQGVTIKLVVCALCKCTLPMCKCKESKPIDKYV